jgi:hypothetical protein
MKIAIEAKYDNAIVVSKEKIIKDEISWGVHSIGIHSNFHNIGEINFQRFLAPKSKNFT